MKKTLLAVAVAASSVTAFAGGAAPVAQSAFAPFYAGMNGGVSMARGSDFARSLNTGFNVGGFMGYRFNENMRVDGSFDYIRHGYNADSLSPSGHINNYLLMANAYYDVTQVNMSGITPYVGAGMGWLHGSDSNLSNSNNAFAWQLATGVNYDFSSNMALGVGYRFVGARVSKQNFYLNLINASLTYKFAM